MAMASWHDDGLDDWEDELDRSDGRPVIAIALGVVVIIAVSLFAFGLIPADLTRHAVAAMGIALLFAAMVWAVAWLLTIRHAALVWRFASAAAFAIVALMMTGLLVGVSMISTRADIATARRIRLDQAGRPAIPRGSSAGPITRRTLAFYNELMEQDHARRRLFLKLGLDKVGQTWAVVGQPSLLDDCGRFPNAQPAVDAIDARVLAAANRFRTDLPGLISEPVLAKQVVGEFDTNFPTSGPRHDRQIQLAREQLGLAAKLCTVLARHRWRPEGGLFGFTANADLLEYRVLSQRWDTIVRDLRSPADGPAGDGDPLSDAGGPASPPR